MRNLYYLLKLYNIRAIQIYFLDIRIRLISKSDLFGVRNMKNTFRQNIVNKKEVGAQRMTSVKYLKTITKQSKKYILYNI